MFVGQEGQLTFADESGAVIWTGPKPEEVGPYPGLPRPRAVIDLGEYDEFSPLVVRTDLGDEEAWNRLQEEVRKPSRDYEDGHELHVIADPVWSGASPEEIVAALLISGADLPQAVFIADEEARKGSMLAVDLSYALSPEDQEDQEESEPSIPRARIEPDNVGPMAVNLALYNMDFSDWS